MASRTVTCLSLHGGTDSMFCCRALQMSHASGVCEVGSKRRRVSEHRDFPSLTVHGVSVAHDGL